MQKIPLTSAFAAAALLLAVPFPALAQTQGRQLHHTQDEAAPQTTPIPEMLGPGTMGPGMMQRMPQGGMLGDTQMPMMGGGGAGMGMGMMDCPMMSQMMRMHPRMMAMMHGGMGAGDEMMGHGAGTGMMMRQGAMSLDSGVVRPIQHLSNDDVSHFFQHRLGQVGNERLKLGEVIEKDGDTITVEIVTVDDSLVDRLEIDRHNGKIRRAQ